MADGMARVFEGVVVFGEVLGDPGRLPWVGSVQVPGVKSGVESHSYVCVVDCCMGEEPSLIIMVITRFALSILLMALWSSSRSERTSYIRAGLVRGRVSVLVGRRRPRHCGEMRNSHDLYHLIFDHVTWSGLTSSPVIESFTSCLSKSRLSGRGHVRWLFFGKVCKACHDLILPWDEGDAAV